jgi:hypothetical protein
MIRIVYFVPNTSGLVCAKNLRKWAEKAFASSTLVFHELWQLPWLVSWLGEDLKPAAARELEHVIQVYDYTCHS